MTESNVKQYPTITVRYSHDDQLAFRRYFTDHITYDEQKAVLDALDHLDLDGLLRNHNGNLIYEARRHLDV